jgi:hypothetical protein
MEYCVAGVKPVNPMECVLPAVALDAAGLVPATIVFLIHH